MSTRDKKKSWKPCVVFSILRLQRLSKMVSNFRAELLDMFSAHLASKLQFGPLYFGSPSSWLLEWVHALTRTYHLPDFIFSRLTISHICYATCHQHYVPCGFLCEQTSQTSPVLAARAKTILNEALNWIEIEQYRMRTIVSRLIHSKPSLPGL